MQSTNKQGNYKSTSSNQHSGIIGGQIYHASQNVRGNISAGPTSNNPHSVSGGGNIPSQAAYGFMTAQPSNSSYQTQQPSARHSATSGATTGSNRSNDRAGNESNYTTNSQQAFTAVSNHQMQKQTPIGAGIGVGGASSQQLNSAAGSNYYYSSNNANTQHLQDLQGLHYQGPQMMTQGVYATPHHQHAPSTLSNKSVGSTHNGKGVQGNNSLAAIQAYASAYQPAQASQVVAGKKIGANNNNGGNISRKNHSNDSHQQNQFSPPSTSSTATGIMAQIINGQKKNQNASNVVSTSSNLNRYESLQSKLKNKRRQQPTGNLIGSNSSQLIGPSPQINSGKHLQSSGDNIKFNQTQKLVMSAFGGANAGAQHQQVPATLNNGGQLSNRKHLKISVDQHSDSSFNNISIKSADKHNSVVRQMAAGLISHKNNTQTLNMKDLSNQISPSSNNNGSILQNFTSSQNSVYSSNFSANSRFNNNRPKNPTETSSLSSKNSDNLSTGGQNAISQQKAVLNDLKKNLLQKAAIAAAANQNAQSQSVSVKQSSKQSAIQVIKDQQQMLIKQHQQSDSLSDTNNVGGSFSSGNSATQPAAAEAILQKPLQSKLYTSINAKLQQSHQSQMKASNSNANLSKIGQQVHLAAQQQLHGATGHQANVPNTPGYKSKFTLMNIAPDSTSKGSNGGGGGDSYRKQNNDIGKKKTSVSKASGAQCGAPFSPKQQNTAASITSKILGINGPKNNNQQQMYLTNLPLGQRNNNGLAQKASAGASVGSNQGTSKKSGRELQNKTHDAILKPHSKPQLIQKNPICAPTQQEIQQQIQMAAQIVGLQQSKLNFDQIQNLIKQQQIMKGGGDTIQEERFEDSEQNTKRESTTNVQQNSQRTAANKQSNPNLIAASLQELQIQQQLSNASSNSYLNSVNGVPAVPQKSKSLLTINIESAESMKRIGTVNQEGQDITAAPLPAQVQIAQQVEEIKQNSTLQAMKEKLKNQIALQHHPFSNPNQPSSQIEVAEPVQYPITPRKALQIYYNNLTEYERTEIVDYNEIYFLGLNAPKIRASSQLQHNCGYDDDRGDYQVVLQDHLVYRYQVLDFLGKGSFGQAIKCRDYKTNEEVAVKIIRNKKRFHHQAGVELNILNYLKENDPDDVNNIIRIKDFCIFRKHLIISFELLSINLYEFIKNNNFNGVSLSLIRRFAIQILQALKYQREHGIIHCDLKPENILLKQQNKSGIKIIDYGSSCFQNQRIYTYIQSRFYRAPEIVLGIPYTTSIDMWSFGCILAELYKGYPLFPGENEMEQLAYVMEIKGVPEDYLLELASRRKLFFDADNQPIIVANSKGKKRRPLTKTLKSVLKCQDQNFLDFLEACLDWDPVNRMTPLEALQHPWILEGLPEKVLLHHQRMFGNRDDKTNIKEATLTPIQGFPPDAENNTIFQLLKTRRAEVMAAKQQLEEAKIQPIGEFDPSSLVQPEAQISQTQGSQHDNNQQPCLTKDQAAPNPPSIQSNNNNRRSTGQQNNKTIQNLMQQLFEEKAQEKSGKGQVSASLPTSQHHHSENINGVIKLQNLYHASSSSTGIGQGGNGGVNKPNLSQANNTTINYMQIVEIDTENQRQQNNNHLIQSILPGADNTDEVDIEEGVTNFNQTQKIPMSLIKQQEKIPINQQVPFYNPKVSGPKLNNYINQAAAAFKQKNYHASSTSNLNLTNSNNNRGGNGGAYLPANLSANLGQMTNNSSMNQGHQQFVTSSNGGNISHADVPHTHHNIHQLTQSSARSGKQGNPYSDGSNGNVSQQLLLQTYGGQQVNFKPNINKNGGIATATKVSQNTGKFKLAQAIKVDLNTSSNQQHLVGGGVGSSDMNNHPSTTAGSEQVLSSANFAAVVVKSYRKQE